MADDPSPNPGSGDQDGPLSQADVDAALTADGGAGAVEDAPADADAGGISQADIDALLAAGAAPAGDDSAESEQLTQGDVDAALAGASSPEPHQRLDSCDRPFDEAAAAMAAAIEEEKTAAVGPVGQPLELPDLGGAAEEERLEHDIDLLHDVRLRVKIELGRTRMLVEDVLKLGEGSLVELDRLAGDPVDVFANDRLIARGEVLVLNDNFCVRIGEVMSGAPDET